MATMIIRALEYRSGSAGQGSGQAAAFSDRSQISAWAKDYINKAYELGLISGRGDNMFAPKETALRSETVKVIYLLLAQLK
ncbi:Endoglucanase precursor [compost metagenome]